MTGSTTPPEDAAAGDDDPLAPGDEAVERGRVLFAGTCEFFAGAHTTEQLPGEGRPEVAFAGRSNVGKSSLINALTGRKALARTSITPGRTQQINFFDLGGRLTLVDLPGYGFAKVSKSRVKAWTGVLRDYLRGRASLRLACVLVDARHGLKDSDEDLLTLLDGAAVPAQVVFTKCDRTGKTALGELRALTEAALKRHPAAFPRILDTSAEDGTGIPALRALLAGLAAGPRLH